MSPREGFWWSLVAAFLLALVKWLGGHPAELFTAVWPWITTHVHVHLGMITCSGGILLLLNLFVSRFVRASLPVKGATNLRWWADFSTAYGPLHLAAAVVTETFVLHGPGLLLCNANFLLMTFCLIWHLSARELISRELSYKITGLGLSVAVLSAWVTVVMPTSHLAERSVSWCVSTYGFGFTLFFWWRIRPYMTQPMSTLLCSYALALVMREGVVSSGPSADASVLVTTFWYVYQGLMLGKGSLAAISNKIVRDPNVIDRPWRDIARTVAKMLGIRELRDALRRRFFSNTTPIVDAAAVDGGLK